MNEILSVLLDALKDSAITLGVVFVIYVILSFIEGWVSSKLEKNTRISPLLGSLFGLIPQCGLSVVASDLFLKNRISMGTLIAVFIACSDEAVPIILSNPGKAIWVLPLLGIKFVLGFVVGYTVDLIVKPKLDVAVPEEKSVHIGCCGHEIEGEEENGIHKHLVHPLIHSLKIFAYVLAVNIVFGLVIYYLGEENISAFLNSSKYLAPIYSTVIGLIPNCVSSVVISEMYLSGALSFGAALSGLIVNAGLGMVVLLKDRKAVKKTLIILAITVSAALISGYIACLIGGF